MNLNFIGEKKIKYLNRKFKLDIVSGIGYPGTSVFEVLTRDNNTYTLHPLNKLIVMSESSHKQSLIKAANIEVKL